MQLRKGEERSKMLIFNKNDYIIYNLDRMDQIYISRTDKDQYAIRIIINDVFNTLCVDDSKELLQKVVCDIYIHMTYASGNYILDLNEFKERINEENTSNV